jgi:RND family efflux transporter MFP subunit
LNIRVSDKKVKQTVVEAIPVKVTSVASGDIKEIFTTTGTVEAVESANVSAKVSGRVTSIRVKLGDYVSKGQVLVSLEKEDFTHQLNQSKTALAQAEVSYKQSRDNFNRKQKLFAEQIISQQDYDSAKNEMDIAANQVRQAQVGIDMIQTQLHNTEVRAPINGYIGKRMVNEGEMVSPGIPLISMVDLAQVYVSVNLSDSYITQAKPKQTASVYLASSSGQNYQGSIVQIAPMADPVTKTYTVKILLDNPGRILKEGMLAQVTLNFNEKKNIFKIPIDAVLDETGTKAVYVIKNNKADRRQVQLGISDGKSVEVISGIKDLEKIVVLGQNNLEDGAKVVVKK